MKRLFLLLFGISIGMNISLAHSGDTIYVPFGSAATLDGAITGNEWDDAASVETPSINGVVYFKHTATDLYIAFISDGYYYSSSGIYLDRNHDAGSAPQTDDIWFHGSMGQFEFVGNGSQWQSVAHSGWDYDVNTANEYKIPFSKCGVQMDAVNIFGVLFSFLDWSISHDEITWPSGGYGNCSMPDNWAHMIINTQSSGTGNSTNANNSIRVFSQLSNNTIIIETKDFRNSCLEIYTSDAKKIRQVDLTAFRTEMDITDLKAGIYLLKVRSMSGLSVHKFVRPM